MKMSEDEKKEIGEHCGEELAWAEEIYAKDPLDPWINGYRNALRTVLHNANRRVEVRTMMNEEERANVEVVTRRLVKAWLWLRHVISTLPEGEDVKHLREGTAILEAGLGVILRSLEVNEKDE